LAEACWAESGGKESLTRRPWPKADPALSVDDEVTVAIQVNGKTRTTIQLPKDSDKALTEAKVLELQTIKDALKDKQIAKVIVVPNRIVNVEGSQGGAGVQVDALSTQNRMNQQFKADLEDKLNPAGRVPANAEYRLKPTLTISTSAIGVARDGTVSRY
ncbi:hypothetical protein OY671_010049, partial [Metschnikowia pulcherrima]